MGSNWYVLLKKARYGQDTVNFDERDQSLPSWNPYAKKKSPNDLGPNMNTQFDGGTSMGDTRDFGEQYDEMHHESLLDQYDEGAVQDSQYLNDGPLDTIADEPMNQGDNEFTHSPIGENAQTLRKAEEPFLDNKPHRLPGGGNFPTPKPFLRNRRSSVLSPLESAWAYQVKKGAVS